MDPVDQGYDDGWIGDVGKDFQDPQTDRHYQAGFAAGRNDRSSGHPYGTSKEAARFTPIAANPAIPPYDGPTMETPGPTTDHPYPEPPDWHDWPEPEPPYEPEVVFD